MRHDGGRCVRVIGALLAALTIARASESLRAQPAPPVDERRADLPPTLTVSGEGESSAQPDRAVVQLVVALTGLIGKELSPPLTAAETVNVSLACTTPGFVPPTSGPMPIPVKATSWTLSGIGVVRGFQ